MLCFSCSLEGKLDFHPAHTVYSFPSANWQNSNIKLWKALFVNRAAQDITPAMLVVQESLSYKVR